MTGIETKGKEEIEDGVQRTAADMTNIPMWGYFMGDKNPFSVMSLHGSSFTATEEEKTGI